MTDYKEFFNRLEDYKVDANFYECGERFSVEDLYQAFKDRLKEEYLEADADARQLHEDLARWRK